MLLHAQIAKGLVFLFISMIGASAIRLTPIILTEGRISIGTFVIVLILIAAALIEVVRTR